MTLAEISRGNIFLIIFLIIFVTFIASLFLVESNIKNDFDTINLTDSKEKTSTFIYLLSFVQYLFIFYIGTILCMTLRFFVFHENDIKTRFPVGERTFFDDTLMTRSGILPTCAVISLFLSVIVLCINLVRFDLIEKEKVKGSNLPKLFTLLPLGPCAFLFGKKYKNLVNRIYFDINKETTELPSS